MTTPIVADDIAGDLAWESDLLSCPSLELCLGALCCSVCWMANRKSEMDSSSCFLNCFGFLPSCTICSARVLTREHFGLVGNDCTDCCIACFCCWCSSVQVENQFLSMAKRKSSVKIALTQLQIRQANAQLSPRQQTMQ